MRWKLQDRIRKGANVGVFCFGGNSNWSLVNSVKEIFLVS